MNFSEVTRFTAGNTRIAQLKDTDGTVLWTDPQFTRADGTSPAYQHTMVSGTQKYAEVDEVGGKSVVWNQLVDTTTASVTPISGKKYYTKIGGTESIITSDGTALSVTGGTDMVCYLTPIESATGLTFTTVAQFKAWAKSAGKDLDNYQAYDTGSVLHFGCNEVVSTDSDNQQIDSLPIPAEVRALEGYGWGIGSVNNKVDFPQKIYRKSIGKYTFTGNENFRYMSVYGFFTQIFTSTIKKPLTEYVVANILMANKTTKSFYDVFAGGNNTDYIGVNINGYVAFSSNLTEVDDFKSYITGKTIYYELATPVETDISQYLDNNLLEVEAGGTVTLKQPNDTEMPLPNSIKYLVKGV